jgi:hypothetical protein
MIQENVIFGTKPIKLYKIHGALQTNLYLLSCLFCLSPFVSLTHGTRSYRISPDIA